MSTAIKTAEDEPSIWSYVFSPDALCYWTFVFCVAVFVFGISTSIIDTAFTTYSYPKIQDKIEAADAHGWQFLLSDGYTVTAPYEVWKQHQPGDRVYVEQHRSFISRRDVLADGN